MTAWCFLGLTSPDTPFAMVGKLQVALGDSSAPHVATHIMHSAWRGTLEIANSAPAVRGHVFSRGGARALDAWPHRGLGLPGHLAAHSRFCGCARHVRHLCGLGLKEKKKVRGRRVSLALTGPRARGS